MGKPLPCSQADIAIHSQLLDLLLDINDSKKIPPHLRYDLRSPTPDASAVPPLEPDLSPSGTLDVDHARAALEEAKQDYASGQITPSRYRDMEDTLTRIITAPKSLTSLSQTSHTTLSSVDPTTMPVDLLDASPTGYLSPAHEDEYLSTLDTYLSTAPPDSQPLLPRPSKLTDREKDKDAQLHNPVSVYNWLRAHDRKLFHEDTEATHNEEHISKPTRAKASPKPASSAGIGSAKTTRQRASSNAVPKQEQEVIDEEGFVIKGGGGDEPAPRSKRKREDDAYRPKGGSSRSNKRKKGGSGAAKKIEEGEEDA